MIALLTTVVLASLIGSLHCAGMCGAFVGIAVNGVTVRPAHQFPLQIAYHGGRLLTYTLLGAVSGAIGGALNHGGALLGFQRAATVIAGASMITFGVVAGLQMLGFGVVPMGSPMLLRRAVALGHRWAAGMTPVRRSLAIGLLTTLLPCGWLYAFVVAAGGTGSPALGAMMMGAFWLGTVPMLAFVGAGIRRLSGSLGPYLPLVTSVAMVVVGVLTVSHRLAITPDALRALHGDGPRSIEAATAHAAVLDSKEMPCCKNHER